MPESQSPRSLKTPDSRLFLGNDCNTSMLRHSLALGIMGKRWTGLAWRWHRCSSEIVWPFAFYSQKVYSSKFHFRQASGFTVMSVQNYRPKEKKISRARDFFNPRATIKTNPFQPAHTRTWQNGPSAACTASAAFVRRSLLCLSMPPVTFLLRRDSPSE